jgi:hypothetical protein
MMHAIKGEGNKVKGNKARGNKALSIDTVSTGYPQPARDRVLDKFVVMLVLALF